MTTPIIITVLICVFILLLGFSIGGDNSNSHFSEIRILKAEFKLKELENKHSYNLASLKSNQELKHRELENQKEIKLYELQNKVKTLTEHNVRLSKELGHYLSEDSIDFNPVQDYTATH